MIAVEHHMNVLVGDFFFFFKPKTACEMVGSDWSSDVCSSDLLGMRYSGTGHDAMKLHEVMPQAMLFVRSEERRVGKECYQPCRSRWSPDHLKKNSFGQLINGRGFTFFCDGEEGNQW